MGKIKCDTCGTLYSARLHSCPQCDFYRDRELARFESCTGVRYPCSCHCRRCFFEQAYGHRGRAEGMAAKGSTGA